MITEPIFGAFNTHGLEIMQRNIANSNFNSLVCPSPLGVILVVGSEGRSVVKTQEHFGAGADVQFLVDVFPVGFDGVDADVQLFGDLQF